MKKIIVLVAIPLLFAFDKQKDWGFTPPGTVKIYDDFYVDVEEVTRLSWAEYQFWTKEMYGSSSEQFRSTLIDTLNWDDKNFSRKNLWCGTMPLKREDFCFPATGITHAQAEAFCKWRTERVKYFLAAAHKKTIRNFEYRLPTEAEWESVSDASGEVFSAASRNKREANFNFSIPLDSIGPLPTRHFAKNRLGLYDITGNAAEMIATPKIAKGGSWAHAPEVCRNGKQQPYATSASWLGFRCICVLSAKQ